VVTGGGVAKEGVGDRTGAVVVVSEADGWVVGGVVVLVTVVVDEVVDAVEDEVVSDVSVAVVETASSSRAACSEGAPEPLVPHALSARTSTSPLDR
jgi:hypothetical protein